MNSTPNMLKVLILASFTTLMIATSPWFESGLPGSPLRDVYGNISASYSIQTADWEACCQRIVSRLAVAVDRGGEESDFSLSTVQTISSDFLCDGTDVTPVTATIDPPGIASFLDPANPFPSTDSEISDIFALTTVCVSRYNSSVVLNGTVLSGTFLTGVRASLSQPTLWFQGFELYRVIRLLSVGLGISPTGLQGIDSSSPPESVSLGESFTLSAPIPACPYVAVSRTGCFRITVNVYRQDLSDYEAKYWSEFWPIFFSLRAGDVEGEFWVAPLEVARPEWKTARLTGRGYGGALESSHPWTLFEFPQEIWKPQTPACVSGSACESLTIAPSARYHHSAVMYRSWTLQDMLDHPWFCRLNSQTDNSRCTATCATDLSCFDATWTDYWQATAGRALWSLPRFDSDDGLQFPGRDPHSSMCPGDCCVGRRRCTRSFDQVGRLVPENGLFMLIFGGRTRQKRLIGGEDLYLKCEAILSSRSDLDESLRSCLEFQSDELWRYSVSDGTWELIKPGTGLDSSGASMGFPDGRFAHGAVALTVPAEKDPDGFTRKYMFIYGGLGTNCLGGICSDFWRFEIPFAPQAYYPAINGEWQQAGNWKRMKDCPYGGRYGHKMVGSSAGDYLFVYGGHRVGEFVDEVLMYRVAGDIWEKPTPRGYQYFTRIVTNYLQEEKTHFISDMSLFRKDSVEDSLGPIAESGTDPYPPQMPSARADAPMLLYELTPEGSSVSVQHLVTISGFNTYSVPYPGEGFPYPTYPYYLSDVWDYDTARQLWTQIQLKTGPSPRRGASAVITAGPTNKKFLMLFGGHNHDSLFSDLWGYDMESGSPKWVQLNSLIPGPAPPGSAFQSFTVDETTGEVFLFGGLNWYQPDLSVTDGLRDLDRRCYKQAKDLTTRFCDPLPCNLTLALASVESACLEDASGFCCDSLAAARAASEIDGLGAVCKLSCQTKAFAPEFAPGFGLGLWRLDPKVCPLNCSGNGRCVFANCVCQPGYSGPDCATPLCPGSICSTDPLTQQQTCSQCSQRGTCSVSEGEPSCSCDPGWTGFDCGSAACSHNCSSTPLKTQGICVADFPASQCICKGTFGGHDCSTAICLNGCSGKGACKAGVCSCKSEYSGPDCSLYVPTAGASSISISLFIVLSILLVN